MALSCLTWNSGKPCIYFDFKNNSCCDPVDYVHVETKRPVCRFHPQAIETQTSETAELAATDSQHTQAKMPTLEETMQAAINYDNDSAQIRRDGDITQRVYDFMSRHFGCA